MASPIIPNSTDATAFFALDSLEAQVMHLSVLLTANENAFNTANPNNLSNRATVAVNYDQKSATAQITLALTDNAIRGRLVDSVIPFLPDLVQQ